jgi:hypothetical protein
MVWQQRAVQVEWLVTTRTLPSRAQSRAFFGLRQMCVLGEERKFVAVG